MTDEVMATDFDNSFLPTAEFVLVYAYLGPFLDTRLLKDLRN